MNNNKQPEPHIIVLQLDDIQKLTKLNKILEKMECVEAEQRKNLTKSTDSTTYTKLINLLHKNYEISTLTANELASHLDLLNLSIVSAVIQKIVRGFQKQLNLFLHFQINFFKKGQRTDIMKIQPSFSSNSIFPEAELISLGSGSNLNLMSDEKNEKKVDLNNRNIKRYSVFKETKSKKALIPPNVTSQENLIASKFTSNENFDQNIAELNNEMAKQETNLYNLGLMEARNIANTSDLQQLSNEINKKFNISTVPIIPLNNQNDDKSKSEKKSLGKSKKNRATISEIVEESPQNNSSPLSRKMTKIDINKMGIVKAHTRSQGTNPDPDIFDINIIYAMEEIIRRRDNSLDEFEETLKNRENNIKELESLNSFLKSDYNNLKGNFEILNMRFAESKVLEANLNIELNNYRKEINILKKEIGNMESKFDKRDQEAYMMKNNIENQSVLIVEYEKTQAGLNKEIEEMKEVRVRFDRKCEEFKQKNMELIEDNDHLRREINELREKTKDPWMEEKMAYEKTIEGLEVKVKELEIVCERFGREVQEKKHLLTLKEIEKDNEILERSRKMSLSIKSLKNDNLANNFNNNSNFENSNINKNNNSEVQTINKSSNNINNIIANEKNSLHKRDLSENYDQKSNLIIEKTGRSELPMRKDSIHSVSEEPFDFLSLKNPSVFKLMDLENPANDVSKKSPSKLLNTWTQTILFDSEEIFQGYLKEKDVSPAFWPDIKELIEKLMGKNPFLFNPKISSRKNSFSNSRKNSFSSFNPPSQKPSNLINYSNIMNKILSPSAKIQIFTETSTINTNNDSKLMKIENQLNLSSESPHYNPNISQLTSNLTTNNQEKNSNLHQLTQINFSEVLQLTNNPNISKPTNFSSSSVLKKHLKSNETCFFIKKNPKTTENLHSPKPSTTVIDSELPQYDQSKKISLYNKKFKLLTNSSSNLKGEESPKINNNFKETAASPNEQKQLWELLKEEKEVIFENMYTKFSELHEDLLASRSDHRKYLKQVVLFKHIKKELGEDFDGNVTMPNLDEFKEFMERMLNKHKRCGKECSHLKRFYEKIGWSPGEKTNLYSNRIEFKPKNMIINSLPKIQ